MHCNKLKAGNQGSVFLKALPKHLLQVHIRKEGIKLKHFGDKEDLTYSILCHQMDMLRQQLKTAEDEVRSLMKGNHPSGREATALSPTRSTETPHASTQQESLGGMLVGSPRDIVTTELIHQRVVVEVTRPPTRDVGTQTFESQLCSSMPNMKLVGQTASPMGSKAELVSSLRALFRVSCVILFQLYVHIIFYTGSMVYVYAWSTHRALLYSYHLCMSSVLPFDGCLVVDCPVG